MADLFIDEQHLPILFHAIGGLLKTGGQFVIETTIAQEFYNNYIKNNFFINHRGVFPGMHFSTISSFAQSALNNSSLSLTPLRMARRVIPTSSGIGAEGLMNQKILANYGKWDRLAISSGAGLTIL